MSSKQMSRNEMSSSSSSKRRSSNSSINGGGGGGGCRRRRLKPRFIDPKTLKNEAGGGKNLGVLEKLEALKKLIPSKTGEVKADELFEETADYIVFLKTQVGILQKLIDFYDGSSSSSSSPSTNDHQNTNHKVVVEEEEEEEVVL